LSARNLPVFLKNKQFPQVGRASFACFFVFTTRGWLVWPHARYHRLSGNVLFVLCRLLGGAIWPLKVGGVYFSQKKKIEAAIQWQ
jgi:hypothetical protein